MTWAETLGPVDRLPLVSEDGEHRFDLRFFANQNAGRAALDLFDERGLLVKPSPQSRSMVSEGSWQAMVSRGSSISRSQQGGRDRFCKSIVALWFVAIAACVALSAAPTSAADPSSWPNVVVILTDDQGWGDLSINGNTNIATPHMDSLAREGAQFDRFFVCPVCAPTRAEFLTGRYHSRGGVHGVTSGAERLDLDEKTIADAFRAAGYATAAFGKWHNGAQYPYHPTGRGFEEYYGFCSGHWGHYLNPVLERNGEIVRGEGYIADDLTSHAIDFITANRERPFFCYVPYNTPHSPFQVPDRFYDKFADDPISLRHRDPEKEDIETTRAALAMCENLDWNIGRILAKLDELKLSDNTIVVFFTDNGPNSWRYNGGMKGRKGSTDEGGVRVPCFIRWPGHIRPGTEVEQIAGAIDLAPTLADLAGIKLVGDKPLDGKSLVPLLDDSSSNWPDRKIFSQQRGRVSVRTQRYRLDEAGRLFDMVKDPGQTKEISDREPQVAQRLAAAVQEWKREVASQAVRDDRPFPVGYQEMAVTYLPARDAAFSGNIKRSASAPNCSFLTNWRDPGDRITWDVEVNTPGRYEAVVYYTCPQKDVGSTIEVALGESNVTTEVTEAHDPPLVGEAEDRVSRGSESYVKDFRPLKLGTIELEKGRGQLTLRALDRPGSHVIDMRCVELTLLDE